jgi:hypothetical protein
MCHKKMLQMGPEVAGGVQISLVPIVQGIGIEHDAVPAAVDSPRNSHILFINFLGKNETLIVQGSSSVCQELMP